MASHLVLGNSSEHTNRLCYNMAAEHNESFHGLLDRWPLALQSGWYHADVGCLSLRELHMVCQQADYLHLVHRNSEDYSDLESYFTTCMLYQYYRHSAPRAQCPDSQLNIVGHTELAQGKSWQQLADRLRFSTGTVIPVQNFDQIARTVALEKFVNTNVLVHFGSVANPTKFTDQLDQMVQQLRQNNNRFLLVRTGVHEPWAKQITDTLLNYPEWCFLHPECFEDQSPFWTKHLADQMIWRWTYLYK